MIKSVIFDLDNTLYSYDKANDVAFQVLCRFSRDRLKLSPERFSALHLAANRIQAQRCGGSPAVHNRLIRYQIILELAGLPVGEAPAMENCYWQTLIDHMEPEPGAAQTMQQLREAGIRIGIGTNMTADWQYAKLDRLSLLPLVDFVVTSEEADAEKPDKRLFSLCAEKAGAEMRECAFVGDNLQIDALAARAAGMLGIWYHPSPVTELPREDIRIIRSLTELPGMIEQKH